MRARNLKPGFFKNADLAELPFEGRLLFAGLWCLADRRGRLEDRPKQIKGEVLPHDNIDVTPLLNGLQNNGFILRYEKDAKRYIQITNFNDHQHPHIKEPESTIPAPEKHQSTLVRKRLTSSFLTPHSLTPDSNDNDTTAKPPKSAVVAPAPTRIDAKALVHNLAQKKTMSDAGNGHPVNPTDMPYRPPNTPLASYLLGIKVLQGYDIMNREWDKTYFKRYARAATDMVSFFKGDWREALKCSEMIIKELESKGLSWTVDTLVKHAPNWKQKIGIA